ncbi:sugar phosphate isomerase/epimerase family protein [Neorhizobium alkalisoli]|uniref:Sugar phosphate isomerase/epimerase n=1 Tax=Neorhizobium alkalisoli TaxID=528178 RepID=A0A561R3H6_9HYPH|nr:TIM barrel protein [Neorhizobium alkalisoli]TWF57157.1 sugar phosphate isomerase/epimerase [Neorhizobium alkalisoli]
MKLAISNLAFPDELDAVKCRTLFDSGVRGVEVAPTRLGDWSSLTEFRLGDFRSMLADQGLCIPSLQAILFNVADAHLLKEEGQFQAMVDHIHRVSDIASILGAQVLVFGAPKQRIRGDLAEDAAFQLGVERFTALAKACSEHAVTIGLEPVPAVYGGDFLPTWQDVQAMVEAVASDHLAVHLDTGCVALGGGDIGQAIAATRGNLRHFHIAEPNLGNFTSPSESHAVAAEELYRTAYNGWLAIEILGKTDKSWDDAAEAIAFAKDCYAGRTGRPDS